MSEFHLQAPPGDAISSVRFAPSSPSSLLVTSWDSTARLYDVATNTCRTTFSFQAPVLCSAFQNDDIAFAGGVDHSLRCLDLRSGADRVIGVHDAPVRSMEYSTQTQSLMSIGWDSKLRVWDPRRPVPAPTLTVDLPGKGFAMAVSDRAHSGSATRVVVATSERHILIFDIRNMSIPEETRESPLKFQTRSLAAAPDGSGFAVGSIEGRVAIEYFSLADAAAQAKKFSFKCHRKGETAFPVNAIAFHPGYGTFATGGADATVSVWDGEKRKRVCQFTHYRQGVASLAFNSNGGYLAVASSYTYEEGERSGPQEDNVIIRTVEDADVKPRAKA